MQVITLNVSVMCCPYACMATCASLHSVQCVLLCVFMRICVRMPSILRGRERKGGVVENDPGADTYETGGLIHKHSSKAPGPGNLRGKLLTSQPWRPRCLLCMRSCDML